jgi:hypothetical protein
MQTRELNFRVGSNGWFLMGLATALSIATGCSSEVDPGPTAPSTGCPSASGCAGGSSLSPSNSADTTMQGPKTGSTGTGMGSGSGSVSAAAPTAPVKSATGIPCLVAPVVSKNCTQCHGATPKFGAPMSLMTLTDFHAAAKSDPTRKVFEVMPARLEAKEIAKRMPPSTSDALTTIELQSLEAWLSAGASDNAELCDVTEAPAPGSDTTVQPISDPTTAISTTPVTYDDPNLTCHKFLAHAEGSMTDPYSVSTQPDLLVSFIFTAPWKEMRWVRSMKAIIDEERVVHHWLLYRTTRPGTDGAIMASTGVHSDGLLMHGWAPGGNDLYFRSDLGAEMPGDAGYQVEFHYNNATGGALPDASGIEVCVTTEQPEEVIGDSWLGTDRIAGTSATGVCDPSTNDPIHLLALQPHMHKTGMHFKAVLNRADGMDEVLLDAPFSFDDQRYYIKEYMVMPGDTITSTCTYSEPATYGASTNTEMCYLYSLYYPRLSLTNGNTSAEALHGPDTCLQ